MLFRSKGKNNSIDLFEPVDQMYAASAAFTEYLAAYDSLESGAEDALSLFKQLHDKYPNDPLVAFHHKRLSTGIRDASIVMHDK